MGERLIITDRSPGIVLSHWGPLFLPLFLDNGTVGALELMDREEAALIRRYPEGITVLALVPEFQVRAMPPGVREKSTEMFGRYAPNLLGAGTVVGGTGFFPSLIRSVVAGAALLSRSRVPQKTFSRIEPAIEWAAHLPGQTPSVVDQRDELIDAVNRMAFEEGVSWT